MQEWIDFTRSDLAYRRQYGGGRQQALAKAIGLKHGWCPHVIDATAGLGRDAFILASLGCQVTLIERHPEIGEGLRVALDAARKHTELVDIIERMQLCQADAKAWLATQEQVDVVYLDPMFPTQKKTALVKKEMRALRQVVGDDQDAGELLQVALEKAYYRVVVKRPRLSEKISDMAPSFVLEGKANRFDVYVKQAVPTKGVS